MIKGGSISVPLTSRLTGLISCMTTDNFCFYLQNRLIQTSQKGDQWYSDTSPLSIPRPISPDQSISDKRKKRLMTMTADGGDDLIVSGSH